MYTLKLVIMSSVIFMLNGCMEQPKFTEKEQKLQAPKVVVSDYSNAYKKLNIMLNKKSGTEKTKLQVATVSNATTGSLQVDIKHFIEKPLIKYLDNYAIIAYDPQYQINRNALIGPNETETWGEYVIVGEISEYDKSVYSEGSGLDVDAEFGGGKGRTTASAGMSDGFAKSSITVDLKIRNSVGLYDTVASNSIELHQKNKTANVGIYLNSIGLGVSKNANMKQSEDHALRLVSEFSLIQLIGRFENLPYWRCFEANIQEDDEVIDNWIKLFNQEYTNNQSIANIELILNRTYATPYVVVDNKLDSNEMKSLLKIREYFNIKTDNFNSSEFYVELMKNAPYFKKLNIFQSIHYEELHNKAPSIKITPQVRKNENQAVVKRLPTTVILTPQMPTRNIRIINSSNNDDEDPDFFNRQNNSTKKVIDRGNGNLILIN